MIDLAHLAELEDNRAEPYYPGTPEQFPNAGATAGLGIDLGQQDQGSMRQALSPETYNAVSPFVGLRGQAAVDALKQHGGFKLSPQQLYELNDLVIRDTERRAGVYANQRATDTGGRGYDELDTPERTVLAGMAHLYGGVNDVPAAHAYADAVVAGDRNGALQALSTLAQEPGPYQGRHAKDLAYLESYYAEQEPDAGGAVGFPSAAPFGALPPPPPGELSVEDMARYADELHLETYGKNAAQLEEDIRAEMAKEPDQRDSESRQRLAMFQATEGLKKAEEEAAKNQGPLGATLDLMLGPKYQLRGPTAEGGIGFRFLTREDMLKDIEPGTLEFSNFDLFGVLTTPWAAIWDLTAATGARFLEKKAASTFFKKEFAEALAAGNTTRTLAAKLAAQREEMQLARQTTMKLAEEATTPEAKEAFLAKVEDQARQIRNLSDQEAELGDALAKNVRHVSRAGAKAMGQEFVKEIATNVGMVYGFQELTDNKRDLGAGDVARGVIPLLAASVALPIGYKMAGNYVKRAGRGMAHEIAGAFEYGLEGAEKPVVDDMPGAFWSGSQVVDVLQPEVNKLADHAKISPHRQKILEFTQPIYGEGLEYTREKANAMLEQAIRARTPEGREALQNAWRGEFGQHFTPEAAFTLDEARRHINIAEREAPDALKPRINDNEWAFLQGRRQRVIDDLSKEPWRFYPEEYQSFGEAKGSRVEHQNELYILETKYDSVLENMAHRFGLRPEEIGKANALPGLEDFVNDLRKKVKRKPTDAEITSELVRQLGGDNANKMLIAYAKRRMELVQNMGKFTEDSGRARHWLVRAAQDLGELRDPSDARVAVSPPPLAAGSSAASVGDLNLLSNHEMVERLAERNVTPVAIDSVRIAPKSMHVDPQQAGLPPNVVGVVGDPKSKRLVAVSNTHLLGMAGNQWAFPGLEGRAVLIRRLDFPSGLQTPELKKLREGPGIYLAADNPVSLDVLRLTKGRRVGPVQIAEELYHVTTAGKSFKGQVSATVQPGSEIAVASTLKSLPDGRNAERAARATILAARANEGGPRKLMQFYRTFVRKEAQDGYLGPIDPDDFAHEVLKQNFDPGDPVELMKNHFRMREIYGGAQNPGVLIDPATVRSLSPEDVRLLTIGRGDVPAAALTVDNMRKSPYANEVLTFADLPAEFKRPLGRDSFYPAVHVGVPISDHGSMMHPGADIWNPARYSQENKIGLNPELPPRAHQPKKYWIQRGQLFLPDGAKAPNHARDVPIPENYPKSAAAKEVAGIKMPDMAPESAVDYAKIITDPGSPEAKRYVQELEKFSPKPLAARRYDLSEDFDNQMRGMVAAASTLRNSFWTTLSAGYVDNMAIEFAKEHRGAMGRYYQRREAAIRGMRQQISAIAQREGFFRSAVDDIGDRFDRMVTANPQLIIKHYYDRIAKGMEFEDIPGHFTKGELDRIRQVNDHFLGVARAEIESLNPEAKDLWMENYVPRIWDMALSQETFKRMYLDGSLQHSMARAGLIGPDGVPIKIDGVSLPEFLIRDGMTEEQFYAAISLFSGKPIPGMKGRTAKAFLGARRRSREAFGGATPNLEGIRTDPDSWMEMYAAGFRPTTYNPLAQTLFKVDQMERFAAHARVFQGLRDQGLMLRMNAKQYEKILGRSFLGDATDAPFVDVTDVIRDFYHERIPGYAVEPGPGHRFYSTPSVATLLRRTTSKGIMERSGPVGKAAFRVWQEGNHLMNSFQLGLSAFHLGVMATESMANELTLAAPKFWTAVAPTATARARRAAMKRLPEIIPGAEAETPFDLVGQAIGHGIKSVIGTSLFLGKGVNTSKRMNQAWTSLDRGVAGLIRGISGGRFNKDHWLQSKIFNDWMEMPAHSIGEAIDDGWVGMTPSHQYDPVAKMIIESVPLAGGRFRVAEHEWRSKMAASWSRVNADMARDELSGVLSKPIHYGGKHLAALLGESAEVASHYIFNNVVPRTKAAAYFEKMRWEMMKMGGDMTRDAFQRVAMKTFDNIDDRFGMVVYDNYFWDKAVKDIAHTLFRAPGWNWGTLKVMGGAAYDGLRFGTDVYRWGRLKGQALNGGKAIEQMSFPEVTDRMSYMITLLTTIPMMGALYQQMMTGTWPELDWSANTVEEWRDNYNKMVFPWNGMTNEDGTKDRSNEPSYMKDILTWLSIGLLEESPLPVIAHKLSPGIAAGHEMISGEDYFRNQLYDPNAPWYQQIGQRVGGALMHSVEPFSIQALTERSRAINEQTTAEGGISFPTFKVPGIKDEISTRALTEAVMGWVPASERFEKSRSMLYMKDIQRRYRPAGPRVPQAQARGEALYNLEKGLVRGDRQRVIDFREEAQGLGINAADIGRITRDAKMIKSGLYILKQFETTPFAVPGELNAALEAMQPQEFAQFQAAPQMLTSRMTSVLRNTPPEEQRYWIDLVRKTVSTKAEEMRAWIGQQQKKLELGGGRP